MQGIGVLLCMPEHSSAAEVAPAELPKRWLQVGEGTCYAAWPVGSTPLHIAAAKGALQIIRAMLQAQVRPLAVRCTWSALQHCLQARVRAPGRLLPGMVHCSPPSDPGEANGGRHCLSELHRHLLMSESHWVTSPAQQQPTAGVIAKVGPLQYPQ